jgi:hypothetical protein
MRSASEYVFQIGSTMNGTRVQQSEGASPQGWRVHPRVALSALVRKEKIPTKFRSGARFVNNIGAPAVHVYSAQVTTF